MTTKRPFWRLPICWLQLCGFRPNSDDTGCWGECTTCGKRAGFVTRADLRAHIEREAEASLQACIAKGCQSPGRCSGNPCIHSPFAGATR